MRCRRCHRELSDPESVRRGYGPVCWAKVQRNQQFLSEFIEDVQRMTLGPLREKLVCQRGEHGEVITNVPHYATHHSPTGFEWGYGGSGPADLALNLAEFVLRQDGYHGPTTEMHKGLVFQMAWAIHQKLKWQLIAKLPREGAEVEYGEIRDAVRRLMVQEQQRRQAS